MLGRRKRGEIDVGRIASSAVEAFLDGEQPSRNGQKAPHGQGGNRLGTVGAVALGAAAVTAGRAIYNRAKRLDVAEVAARAEDRLKR